MKVNFGKSNLIAFIFVCLSTTVVASNPINHNIWSNLLANHVTEDGKVNYKGFISDKAKLNEYLNLLANSNPEESWGKDNIMVFWINAYNAFTIKLIVDNYPLKSIMDLKFDGKSAWDYAFIKINNQEMTLNYIEHEILRKNYKDPRIHFAVNCASYSCPRLLNKAFASDNLNEQLDKMTKEFVNNNLHNKLSGNKVEISQLFSWYKDDFTKDGTLVDFLNKYSNERINSGAEISYIEYTWSLNSQ